MVTILWLVLEKGTPRRTESSSECGHSCCWRQEGRAPVLGRVKRMAQQRALWITYSLPFSGHPQSFNQLLRMSYCIY